MSRTMRRTLDLVAWTAGALTAALLIADQALAADGARTPADVRWKTECGSCHMAYPPQLLPARSWDRIMSRLDRHFGADASLDPAAASEITAFLQHNADSSRRSRGVAPTMRITQTPWFRDEHDEVPPAVWAGPAVKSASNCSACHTTAEQGDFRESNIRIPR